MKILATVLLGPGSETIVGDAIRSANAHVDGFVLIESGGGGAAMRAAYEAVAKPSYTAHFEWTGDYGAARQFALDEARAHEATHALTLDPDERLELTETFRARVEAYPQVEVWILADKDTGYFKERVIRTDTPAFWHGRVCEFLDGRDMAGAHMDGHFLELPKDDAAERRRWERGVVECQRMIDAGDDCYRWRRHMGSCLMGLGRQEEALEQYEKALPLALNPDETAWMRYLICEQRVLSGRIDDARSLAATGLAEHAGFVPEFGWILAYTDFKADRLQNASRWAQLVLNTPPDKTRIGFRGVHCKKGAKDILAAVHTPAPDRVEQHGVQIPADGVSETMKRVMMSGQYEAEEAKALSDLLEPTDRVLELGSGIGFLAALCAKLLGNDSVLTVEADPQMEEPIRATFLANEVAPTLLIAAVSGSGAPMALRRSEDFWSTKTEPATDPESAVDGVALSSLVARHRPTVIICDIEGSETSLTETVLPGVRAVLIEVHSEEADDAVGDWLSAQNFSRNDVSRRVRLYERTDHGST